MSNYESVQNDITKHMNSVPCHVDCDYDSSNIELSAFTCSDDDANETMAREEDEPQRKLHAGAVMGIYNVSIATPQIIAAIGSSCLFWILGRLGIDDGEAVGWIIRLGGLSSLAAAWLALGIEEEQGKLDRAERQ
jgi:solute carrier family 45 protein 1/2/4